MDPVDPTPVISDMEEESTAFGAVREESSSDEVNPAERPYMQNLFVMRHGERMDDADEVWAETAPRPWDPPLTEKGKYQAFVVGKRLKREGWNITRVLVSPFLRCVQTAAEVITALCLVDSSSDPSSSREAVIDPSRVKVSFEFGLSELMNARAIRRPPEAATAGASSGAIPWHLELSELAAMFPAGTFEPSVKSVWPQIPAWRESTADAHQRYASTLLSVANKFVRENVLCITHGQGVGVSVAEFQFLVYAVDYCAHSHVQRPIYSFSSDGSFSAGEWELLTESGPSGVLYGKFKD
ncbi:hypothetical protein R1flu_024371 [Riccia fluitans]|uniref:Phosphoglycerate mutase family protein n=1 Tax=Riccia fluitans TaxID=41844 RepID=A0ABD1XUP6_9MARC